MSTAGTQLFRQVQKGQLSVPSDDITAVMYESARRILQKRGYLQYEVSNFARNVSSTLFLCGCVSLCLSYHCAIVEIV